MENIALDKQYIAGTYSRFPVCITHGRGSLLYGDNGKEYIDMGSGIGVNTFGACDPGWVAAVAEQLGKLQHASNLYYTEPGAKLARLLCEKTGMSKVFLCNSGAEANECAIKAARKYAALTQGEDCFTIATLKNSFHGRTLTTLAATGQDKFHGLYKPLTPGFAYIDAENPGELESLAKSTKLAAVMIECIQGEGGVVPLSQEYVGFVREFTEKHGILLIIDEV
ncbi:MAG: aminotransferase class III-fold pyridoxal phosphate-dependent enzyme, partial [Clostridia bacterium]|nr:aminotransferase class III-fold pyridoxal phosphate-dependent enzyme [Clostridia bacterium]